MPTYVYCPIAKRVVERGMEAGRRRDNGGPSLLAAPMVMGLMGEVWNPAANKVFDSREKYNRATREHGGIDIGKKEHARLMERGHRPVQTGPTVKQSLKEALQRQGYL